MQDQLPSDIAHRLPTVKIEHADHTMNWQKTIVGCRYNAAQHNTITNTIKQWLMLKIDKTLNSHFSRRAHYSDVIMGAMASQITSLTIVYSTVHSGTDQRKHQSSASLTFVQGIHRWPVNSPHKWPVTRKTFPFDDVTKLWTHIRFDISSSVSCWCLLY